MSPRKSYTEEFKLQVLSELEAGATVDELARKHKIPKATIRGWHRAESQHRPSAFNRMPKSLKAALHVFVGLLIGTAVVRVLKWELASPELLSSKQGIWALEISVLSLILAPLLIFHSRAISRAIFSGRDKDQVRLTPADVLVPLSALGVSLLIYAVAIKYLF